MKYFALLLLTSCLASCVAESMHRPPHDLDSASSISFHEVSGEVQPVSRREFVVQDGAYPSERGRTGRPDWNRGQSLLQGFLGLSQFETVEREGGGTADVDGDEGDLDEIPLIGGGAQHKLGGERIDYGLEGLLSFGGIANASAFAIGGGGAVVAVDVDLLIFDLYGGPFVSTFIGDRLRLYAGAGPLLEWADYSQSDDGSDDHGSGFGFGTYVRAGIELVLPSRTMIGLGARWSDTTVDLGGELGDLDMEGLQLLLTVSRGI